MATIVMVTLWIAIKYPLNGSRALLALKQPKIGGQNLCFPSHLSTTTDQKLRKG